MELEPTAVDIRDIGHFSRMDQIDGVAVLILGDLPIPIDVFQLILPLGKLERIELGCGDILKITASGQQATASFNASHLAQHWGCWPMWTPEVRRTSKPRTAEQEYLDELKSVACCYGFSPESVDRLLESGFSTDDIEEFLYEGEMY